MKHDPKQFLVFEGDGELWLRDIIENHYEEAWKRALSLIEEGRRTGTGCIVTDTVYPRKVVLHRRQTYAYRFILCVLEWAVVGRDQVVRHRCHERLCVNPQHLELGTQADNKRDDWDYWAGGVDHDFL